MKKDAKSPSQAPQGLVLIKDLSGDVCAGKESFHLLQNSNLKQCKNIQGTDTVMCQTFAVFMYFKQPSAHQQSKVGIKKSDEYP